MHAVAVVIRKSWIWEFVIVQNDYFETEINISFAVIIKITMSSYLNLNIYLGVEYV